MVNLEKAIRSDATWDDAPQARKSAWDTLKDSSRNTAVVGAMTLGAAAMLFGAAPASAQARQHAANRGPAPAQATATLDAGQTPEGYNGQFMGEQVANFRADVFRHRDDAVHPPRTHNYKWGWRLGIFDFSCDNYIHQLINEFDAECPTGPAPPRRLTAHLFVGADAKPQVRYTRIDELSAMVPNATDDDFMDIYNLPKPDFEINNLTSDSTISLPGIGGKSVKMSNYQQVDNALDIGLNPADQKEYHINQEHMRQLAKFIQASTDPWTIYTVTEAVDGSGKPIPDAYAITAYAVEFSGVGMKGETTKATKELCAVLYWNDNRMDRTCLNPSPHQDPEIFAGEPVLNGSNDNIPGFAYGVTNKYKIDKNTASTYVPVDDLVKKWNRINPYNPGHAPYLGANQP